MDMHPAAATAAVLGGLSLVGLGVFYAGGLIAKVQVQRNCENSTGVLCSIALEDIANGTTSLTDWSLAFWGLPVGGNMDVYNDLRS